MKYPISLLFILLFFNPLKYAAAQDLQQKILTAEFQSLKYLVALDSIEKQHNVSFFYKDDWINEKIVPSSTKGISLGDFVLMLKKDNALHAVFYGNDFIILTSDAPLKTSIPQVLFDSTQFKTSLKSLSSENNSKEIEPVKVTSRIVAIGSPGKQYEGSHANITGYVKEAETGEPIIGAVVYVSSLNRGVTTDLSGYFVINVPKGKHLMSISSLGREKVDQNILVYSDGKFNVELEEKITQLAGATIVAQRHQNVTGLQIGMDKLDVKTIKQLPSSMGEADLVKAALLLPGVQSVGEAAAGFNVRGGSTDQNLMLINDAPVFNSSHLFGFFSAFNPDVVKDFELYKSGIPAEYGGRISSVFDIKTRQGNRKEFSGSGGISPITGKLTLEGPLFTEKASFLLGGRSSYSNWILKRLNDASLRNSAAEFYDVIGRLSYDVNSKNAIDISGYLSNDYFRLNSDTTYMYSNKNGSIIWKHIFNDKLISNFKGIYSSYLYDISSESNPLKAYKLQYQIDYFAFNTDFSWFPNNDHAVKFGIQNVYYNLNPGSKTQHSESSELINQYLQKEKAFEGAVYLSDEYSLTSRLTVYGGIRFSYFVNLGPASIFQYQENQPMLAQNINDTLTYPLNNVYNSYSGPEMRLSVRYILGHNSSLKFSYNRMRQYLHMLSNTMAISPTDTWKLSGPHIKPQVGDQIATGYYLDFYKNKLEFSVEAYYKKVNDILEYKGGAELIMNEAIETDLMQGTGNAYGIEFLLKKKSGRINGWLAYTYSRTFITVTSPYPREEINFGLAYPANYDKPHDLTIVGNFKFNRRLSISSNVTYSTGRPYTSPMAKYSLRETTFLHYSNRNAYRVEDYFRWDLSINLEGNLKSNKLLHSTWSASVYNLTGRDNVYSIYFDAYRGNFQGYKMSIFTQPIFTITYAFKF